MFYSNGKEKLISTMIHEGLRVHFMGIGGIGMSGLAGVLLKRGCIVSGCDSKGNPVSAKLAQSGAKVHVGHHLCHVQDVDLVVYSSAVSEEEPERREAARLGIPTISRGQLLGVISRNRKLIAVAGAHGKTTTSGMAGELLLQAGWDPTVLVGGIMRTRSSNVHVGKGTFLVAETDESDGSFLHLSPEVGIITNIDKEHLNHYHSFERLIDAFEQFVSQIQPGGTLISCHDDPVVRRHLNYPKRINYGLDPWSDVTATAIQSERFGSSFQGIYKGRSLGAFRLHVPGKHNIVNALSVISLGLLLDIPLITIREALANFKGMERRFEVMQLPADIWCVEDYAHHPSEIRATLSADASSDRHRLVVFQPHRFSRTKLLEQELTQCFESADGVIVTDVYAAFEAPIPDVSGERLANLIRATGHPCVRYVPRAEVSGYVTRIAVPGDTIFFLGAGDIGELCHDVAARLRAPERVAS